MALHDSMNDHREVLSNDFGAVAGLLCDVGNGRYPPPPRDGDAAAQALWETDLARARDEANRSASVRHAEDDRTHTEVQEWLRDLAAGVSSRGSP